MEVLVACWPQETQEGASIEAGFQKENDVGSYPCPDAAWGWGEVGGWREANLLTEVKDGRFS